MTNPSQFSLEEENFYKDIQDLLKNSSQNEKELSSFLQRYMDLLARADLDDETLIINFTKAGLIIEASAKVYGTKVDRLWNNLEDVLLSLRSKSHGQSKHKSLGGEEMEMEVDESKRRLSVNSRRRKKISDTLVSADDFIEIDNSTGLLEKNANEGINRVPENLKFCEKVPNMFIKNKQRRKKIDICLNKNVEEKDVIRLRDWVVSTECLLVKEIYTSNTEDDSTNNEMDESLGFRHQVFDVTVLSKCSSGREKNEELGKDTSRLELGRVSPLKEAMNSLNVEALAEKSGKHATLEEENILPLDKSADFLTDIHDMEDDLNISKESDLAKFPNVLDRGPKACLVDVDEVLWHAEKLKDLIPDKALKSGKLYKSFNAPCRLCKKKEAHQGKKITKKCMNRKRKDNGLDSYFIPHVQPSVVEPHFGILPDQELISTFKQENKIIEQLIKKNKARNLNEAFHPHENSEELKNFLGFDGFEKTQLKLLECNEDEMEASFDANLETNNADDEPNFGENNVEDFELPVPVTVESVRCSVARMDCVTEPKDDDLLAESEYQKLVQEGLKDHLEGKSVFVRNKELGLKISKWHEMISGKIEFSEKRGAMNMKVLADKIMTAFPAPSGVEFPQMTFRSLVKNESVRDVARYFFGCLQLTNEGNLDIQKSDPRPLVTDCMVITRLRSTRKNCDLDDSTTGRTPTKDGKTLNLNRKRNSQSMSPLPPDNKCSNKTKRRKQETEKGCKRKKYSTASKGSKKIRRSPFNGPPTESKRLLMASMLSEKGPCSTDAPTP